MEALPSTMFDVPQHEFRLPSITPHHIALCFLVKGYLSPGPGDPGGNWTQRQALGDALLKSMRTSTSIREPTIWELASQLKVRSKFFCPSSASHSLLVLYTSALTDECRWARLVWATGGCNKGIGEHKTR
jgi:hypothetical protein